MKIILASDLEVKNRADKVASISRAIITIIDKNIRGDKIVDEGIENLSTATKTKDMAKSKKSSLAKSKRSNLTKSKKLDLAKGKKSNSLKSNLSKINFLSCKAKKAFIYLQKVFIKVQILHHFKLKCHIKIKIVIL